MSNERFAFGDQVRHANRPEWGIGSVVKAEDCAVNGKPSQRVSVRFPGAGVKSLIAAHAELQRVAPETVDEPDVAEPHPVHVWEKLTEDDWLGPVAQRKIEEAMIRLPEQTSDPFQGVTGRLAFTLKLYRFDRTGRGLVDWAVAQTGLDDPLSRFNRHELERYFDRWALELDAQLGRLVAEAAAAGHAVEALLAEAPPTARKALRRVNSVR